MAMSWFPSRRFTLRDTGSAESLIAFFSIFFVSSKGHVVEIQLVVFQWPERDQGDRIPVKGLKRHVNDLIHGDLLEIRDDLVIGNVAVEDPLVLRKPGHSRVRVFGAEQNPSDEVFQGGV